MARVLFVTWDGGGNVPPAVGIAAELARRGHAVRFLGHEQQRTTLEAAGFGFTAYEHARAWSSTEPIAGLAAARRFAAMFTDRGTGIDLLAAVERDPPDLVVIDCMSLGALQAAQRAGLRRVVLVHTYYQFVARNWSRGPIGLVARLKGQQPARLWASAARVLVATERALDPAGAHALPASVRYLGVVQAAPLSATPLDEREPRVLVSLSTIYYPGQDAALQSILDALAGLPLRATVTLGPVDPAGLRPPPNVTLHRQLPHADVMPGVRLVIGHGGHATTMRALAHDVPLLVMPMHPMLDQKMIGDSVAAHGAARVVTKKATPEQLRLPIVELSGPGAHRPAAARLGAGLRAANGAVRGADELEGLLGGTGSGAG